MWDSTLSEEAAGGMNCKECDYGVVKESEVAMSRDVWSRTAAAVREILSAYATIPYCKRRHTSAMR